MATPCMPQLTFRFQGNSKPVGVSLDSHRELLLIKRQFRRDAERLSRKKAHAKPLRRIRDPGRVPFQLSMPNLSLHPALTLAGRRAVELGQIKL